MGASTPFQYFTAHEDAAIGHAVSEGRRNEFAAFGWNAGDVPDPQSMDTFARSRLNWDEHAIEPHADLLAWYRALIAFRRNQPALRDGDYRSVQFDVTDDQVFVVRRGAIELACNLSERPATIPAEGRQLALASAAEIRLEGCRLWLSPDSVAILLNVDRRRGRVPGRRGAPPRSAAVRGSFG